MSVGADKKLSKHSGRGALEVCDHCLLEDSSERRGALDSDGVVPETARDGWRGNVRAGACQRALTETQTLGRRRT